MTQSDTAANTGRKAPVYIFKVRPQWIGIFWNRRLLNSEKSNDKGLYLHIFLLLSDDKHNNEFNTLCPCPRKECPMGLKAKAMITLAKGSACGAAGRSRCVELSEHLVELVVPGLSVASCQRREVSGACRQAMLDRLVPSGVCLSCPVHGSGQ